MPKYELTISGHVIVQVEAEDEEQAKDKALQETAAGELYDYEFDEIQVLK